MKTHWLNLSEQKKLWLSTLILFSILIANALFINFCAFRGFYLFDFGLFLDGAWRVYKGQRVYADFYFYTGPLHLYMLAVFFWLFGFGKAAILAHLLVVGSTVIIVTFFSAIKRLPLFIVTILTLLSATCYYTNRPHPWYDHSAYLWGILATWALITYLPFQKSRQAFKVGIICGAMVVFALLTKTNIGLAYGFAFLIVLLAGSEQLSSLKGYVIGAVTSFLFVILSTRAPHAFFDNMHQALSSGIQQNKIQLLFSVQVWLKNFYWLPALIVLCNVLLADRRTVLKHLALFALFFGTAFVALFSLNTGSECYPANLSLMGIYLTLVFILLEQITPSIQQSKKWFILNRLTYWALVIFAVCEIVFTVTFAYARATQDIHPEHRLPQYRNGFYELKTKPFQGWRFDVYEGQILDEIVQFVNLIPKKDSLLVLSHLFIVYSLAGRNSYRGIPVDFNPGTDPAPGEQWHKVHERILNNPPDWILVSKEPGRIANELVEYLQLEPLLPEYKLIKTWGKYGILRRNSL